MKRFKSKRRLKTILFIWFFAFGFLLVSTNTTPKVDAGTTDFTSTNSDGYLYRNDALYDTARNSSAAEYSATTQDYLSIGQTTSGGYYSVFRTFLYFDTSILPDNGTLTSANLTLTFSELPNTDFNVTIQNGQPTYPSDPLDLADYDMTFYSGNGGQVNTSTVTLDTQIAINITELSWISKTTTTKLCLRSSQDINYVAPTSNEKCRIYSSRATFSWKRPKLTVAWSGTSYTFKGLYSEDTGLLLNTGVNVTAYFSDGTPPVTFEVNGTEMYSSSSTPLYFFFDLTNPREYWVLSDEEEVIIYIFDGSTTVYTISFLDLAGVLDESPYVEAKRYVNGTLQIIERRKVDIENKVVMSLVCGIKYTLILRDGASYSYGDLSMTSTTTVQLTLRGVEFPKETLLTYKYVRIYADRSFGTPNGNITIVYQDTLSQTDSAEIFINYKNGTNAYNAIETTSTFVHTWTSALNNTDYQVEVIYSHERYGEVTWRQYFPRSMSTAPWGLDFLGTSLPFATSILIPAFLILFVAGCFSVINAEVGAFMAVIVAAVLTYLGWINISAGFLITAACLTILMGLIYAKRRVQT